MKVAHGEDRVLLEIECARRDSDEDGIDDAVDQCPEHKETINKLLDRDGCPDPDADLDLFVDSEDACVKQAGVAPDGCPEKDADGDTIADHLDACPNAAEDIDGVDDADGCPEGEVAQVSTNLSDQLWKKRSIEMRRGNAKPSKAGQSELGLLGDDVLARPGEILRARVVVWQSRGEAKSLGRRRGKSVVRTLTESGLDEAKVEIELAEVPVTKGRVDVFLFVAIGDEVIETPP